MNGSTIALGWLIATVIFALLGNAWLTVAFFVGAALFGVVVITNDYTSIKQNIIETLIKGETDES